MSPLVINLLFDFLIAVFAIPYAASGLSGVIDLYNYGWSQLPIRILAGIAMGMVLIFGSVRPCGGIVNQFCRSHKLIVSSRIIHLVLFAVRCRMAFLMESWASPWSLPSGQLTFEVSIKLFKEPQKPSQGEEDSV